MKQEGLRSFEEAEAAMRRAAGEAVEDSSTVDALEDQDSTEDDLPSIGYGEAADVESQGVLEISETLPRRKGQIQSHLHKLYVSKGVNQTKAGEHIRSDIASIDELKDPKEKNVRWRAIQREILGTEIPEDKEGAIEKPVEVEVDGSTESQDESVAKVEDETKTEAEATPEDIEALRERISDVQKDFEAAKATHARVLTLPKKDKTPENEEVINEATEQYSYLVTTHGIINDLSESLTLNQKRIEEELGQFKRYLNAYTELTDKLFAGIESHNSKEESDAEVTEDGPDQVETAQVEDETDIESILVELAAAYDEMPEAAKHGKSFPRDKVHESLENAADPDSVKSRILNSYEAMNRHFIENAEVTTEAVDSKERTKETDETVSVSEDTKEPEAQKERERTSLQSIDASPLGFKESEFSEQFLNTILTKVIRLERDLNGRDISGIDRMPINKSVDQIESSVRNLQNKLQSDFTPSEVNQNIETINSAIAGLVEKRTELLGDTLILEERARVDESASEEKDEELEQKETNPDATEPDGSKSVGTETSDVLPNPQYSKAREAWKGSRQNYFATKNEYEKAVKEHHESISAKGQVGRTVAKAKEWWNGTPEAILQKEQAFKEQRAQYAEGLQKVLTFRGKAQENNRSFDAGTTETRTAFSRRFVLEPRQDMLKIEKAGLLTSEAQQRLERISGFLKNNKWRYRAGVVVVGGAAGFAGGGVLAAIAGASYSAGKIARAVGGGMAGAAAGDTYGAYKQEQAEAKQADAEQTVTERFTVKDIDTLERLLQDADAEVDSAKRNRKLKILTGAVLGGGLAANIENLDDIVERFAAVDGVSTGTVIGVAGSENGAEIISDSEQYSVNEKVLGDHKAFVKEPSKLEFQPNNFEEVSLEKAHAQSELDLAIENAEPPKEPGDLYQAASAPPESGPGEASPDVALKLQNELETAVTQSDPNILKLEDGISVMLKNEDSIMHTADIENISAEVDASVEISESELRAEVKQVLLELASAERVKSLISDEGALEAKILASLNEAHGTDELPKPFTKLEFGNVSYDETSLEEPETEVVEKVTEPIVNGAAQAAEVTETLPDVMGDPVEVNTLVAGTPVVIEFTLDFSGDVTPMNMNVANANAHSVVSEYLRAIDRVSDLNDTDELQRALLEKVTSELNSDGAVRSISDISLTKLVLNDEVVIDGSSIISETDTTTQESGGTVASALDKQLGYELLPEGSEYTWEAGDNFWDLMEEQTNSEQPNTLNQFEGQVQQRLIDLVRDHLEADTKVAKEIGFTESGNLDAVYQGNLVDLHRLDEVAREVAMKAGMFDEASEVEPAQANVPPPPEPDDLGAGIENSQAEIPAEIMENGPLENSAAEKTASALVYEAKGGETLKAAIRSQFSAQLETISEPNQTAVLKRISDVINANPEALKALDISAAEVTALPAGPIDLAPLAPLLVDEVLDAYYLEHNGAIAPDTLIPSTEFTETAASNEVEQASTGEELSDSTEKDLAMEATQTLTKVQTSKYLDLITTGEDHEGISDWSTIGTEIDYQSLQEALSHVGDDVSDDNTVSLKLHYINSKYDGDFSMYGTEAAPLLELLHKLEDLPHYNSVIEELQTAEQSANVSDPESDFSLHDVLNGLIEVGDIRFDESNSVLLAENGEPLVVIDDTK